jgi:aminoglycoside phosphotransferase (APT) family kinase protein
MAIVSNTSLSSTPKNSSSRRSIASAQPPRRGCRRNVVDVDDEGHRFSNASSTLRGLRRVSASGPVDFGEQRRHHRRAGRRLDHLQARAGGTSTAPQRWRMSSAISWLARSRSALGGD